MAVSLTEISILKIRGFSSAQESWGENWYCLAKIGFKAALIDATAKAKPLIAALGFGWAWPPGRLGVLCALSETALEG